MKHPTITAMHKPALALALLLFALPAATAQNDPQKSALSREKGLTKNLYKVSGNGNRGGHAWLEYRTTENTYIIDPTWSDDSQFNGQQKKKLRESSAYGKQAFFITYEEDKRIFNYQGYDHSSYTTRRIEVALWDKEGETP